MKRSTADALICVAIYAVLAGFLIQYPAIPAEAQAYPLFMIIASTLVNTLIFVGAVRKIKAEEAPALAQKKDFFALMKMIALYCVLMGAYIFLIEKISYIGSSILFIFLSLKFLRVKSWPVLILLPLILTLVVYFAFTRLLSVSLPVGTWFYISL